MNDLGHSDRYQLRSATWEDVAAIVDLRNASSRDTRGTDVTAAHWQRRHFHETGIDLATDTWVILDGEVLIAYVELTAEAPYVINEMVGVVRPAYRGQGLGTSLLQWAGDRARQASGRSPDGSAVFVQTSVFDSNQPSQDLLAAQDYVIVRDFVYLTIELNSKPPDPVLAPGLEIRPLKKEDWAKVGPALDEAFRDHWGVVDYDGPEEDATMDEDTARLTDPDAFDSAYFNSPGLCFVAWDGDKVAGSCLCNATTVEYPGSGYIGSLSIRRPWRRKGLGLALTQHALNACFSRGITHVVTDTDGDSLTGAYRVYQNAGMEIFRREHVFEKTIRPGRDLVTRGLPKNLETELP